MDTNVHEKSCSILDIYSNYTLPYEISGLLHLPRVCTEVGTVIVLSVSMYVMPCEGQVCDISS